MGADPDSKDRSISAGGLNEFLRQAVAAFRDERRSDAELLAQFVETNDQDAFRALVGRHGLGAGGAGTGEVAPALAGASGHVPPGRAYVRPGGRIVGLFGGRGPSPRGPRAGTAPRASVGTGCGADRRTTGRDPGRFGAQ